MQHQWAEGKRKDEFTAEVINSTINELIAANAAGEKIRDRVFISLIGYSGENDVVNIRSGYLSDFAEKSNRVKSEIVSVPDGLGGQIQINVDTPVFIEPLAIGRTPMGDAFEFAKRLISGWITKKSDNPAPVIINVTDGHPEPEDTQWQKTIDMAKDIMSLNAEDGQPLIFNVHIGNDGNRLSFPETTEELGTNRLTHLLFEISSVVPDVYKKAAKDLELGSLGRHARGFVSNASPETLLQFINFGSSGGIDRL